jgi:hypothetical protein
MKHEYKNYTIEIFQDLNPESPREWENLGKMICFHNRYNLGDDHDLTIEDIKKIVQRKDVIALPLYLYDHSGITISSKPFSCPWDSGQIGYIYVDYKRIRKEYGWKKISQNRRDLITNYLKSEIAVYDQYLTGDIYGYAITDKDNEDIDSCYGFYGYDNCKNEAESIIDWTIKKEISDHLKTLKSWIKNKVPVIYRQPCPIQM